MGFMGKVRDWFPAGGGARAEISPASLSLDSLNAALGLDGAEPPVAQVSHAAAAGFPAYAGGVSKISSSIASLPLRVLDREGFDVENAPILRVLRESPNPYMNGRDLRRALVHQLLYFGNAFCFIDFDGRASIRGLYPRDARTLVSIEVDADGDFLSDAFDSSYDVALPAVAGGSLTYTFANRNRYERLPDWRVLHVKAETSDGLLGISPIERYKRSLGLSIAARDYATETFRNGGTPLLVLGLDRSVGSDIKDNVIANAKREFQASGRRRGVFAVGKNTSVQVVQASLDNMQFLQTRTFDVTEAARMLSIHPVKLGSAEKMTYDNMERVDLDYAEDALRPLTDAIDAEISRKGGLWARRQVLKHDLSGVVRETDIQRYRAYTQAIQAGWMTPNEAREREGLETIPGLDATVPIDRVGSGGGGSSVAPSVGTPNPGARAELAVISKNGADKSLTNGHNPH